MRGYWIRSLVTLILVTLAIPVVSVGETPGDADGEQFTIQDFAWLTGYWSGDGFGGTCEEIWSRPSAGSIVGSFKLSVDDAVQFYEIFTLTIDSAGLPTLRIKHFNADLTGWEEKDKVVIFPYESSTDTSVTLGGVTYNRLSDDSMQIEVRLKDKAGKTSVETITLGRIRE